MCNLYKGLFEKVSICYVTFGYTEAIFVYLQWEIH